MNEMQVFNNEQFGQVRTTTINGEPWFVAADVCKALDISDTSKVMDRLDDDEGGRIEIAHPQNPHKTITVNAVNESGLYELVLGSRKKEAKAFKRWIKHEVLPSIRKHGAYATPQTIDNIINNPDFGIRLLTELKAERRKSATLKAANDQLAAKIEADKPKVQFADSVTASKESITIGELAKILKQNGLDIGRNRLYARLRSERYLNSSYKNYNIPSQYAMNLGLFEIIKYPYTTLCGVKTVGTSIYITPHGQQYFINKLLKAAH